MSVGISDEEVRQRPRRYQRFNSTNRSIRSSVTKRYLSSWLFGDTPKLFTMRQALAIFALIAMYGIIAYSIGIPLPSPLWRWFFALVALEFVLLYHEQRVIDHLVGPVSKPEYTAEQNALLKRIENGKMERMFVLLVAVGSAFSMTALFCCHDSVWSGPQDGAQIFGLILVGGFHICLFMAAAIGERHQRRGVFKV